MHALPYQIDCKLCGCPDVEVLREPRPGAWFTSGVGQCNACGAEFAFREPEESTEQGAESRESDSGRAVIYRPVRCPMCSSEDVPVQRTDRPVRYHRCRDCGANFKSVQKVDGRR